VEKGFKGGKKNKREIGGKIKNTLVKKKEN